MRFDHRYFWNTPFVISALRAGAMTEAAAFRYFLAVMGFDWLQFTLIAITPAPVISPWSAANAWATFVITMLGLPFLHYCNGGAAGRQFLQRYFALSVTVGWKFVVGMLASTWVLSKLLVQASAPVQGWSSVALLALINLLMFWRIGFRLRSLAGQDVPARPG